MKKRLYCILLMSFTGFFLLLSLIFYFVLDIDINVIKSNWIVLSLSSIILILILSYIASIYIYGKIFGPFKYFFKHILNLINHDPSTDTILPEDTVDILNILKDYGYDIKEVEKGIESINNAVNIRREFSANVSHELKSPLTSIKGYAELISQGVAKENEIIEFANRINLEGDRLLNMIDETIKLSKIDNNKIRRENFVNLDLGKIIIENIESFDVLIKEKNMEINFDYEEIPFYGNDKLMFDLFRNLISNAIKYSSKENPRLDIKYHDKGNEIEIKFIDNGIGISKENQERIFERFYVVDKSRGNKTGTGLGLSLVKNIVNTHSGSIELRSSLGYGSTFIVNLPKNQGLSKR